MSSAPASQLASELYPYTTGQIIPQTWNPAFVFFAFATAFVASYSAVRLLDHALWWREENARRGVLLDDSTRNSRGGGGSGGRGGSNKGAAASSGGSRHHRRRGSRGGASASAASTAAASDSRSRSSPLRLITHPTALASLLLGFGTVWSMHFVGMSAVTLPSTPQCYDWGLTMASLFSAVVLMWVGVQVASRDLFSGEDRCEILKGIVIERMQSNEGNRSGGCSSSGCLCCNWCGSWGGGRSLSFSSSHRLSSSQRSASSNRRHEERDSTRRAIHHIAFFHAPQHIICGGIIAASGALVMHYTGMMALRGPFTKTWNAGCVAGSVVLGVAVCIIGFWIIFRLFHWKIESFWLRPVCAAVIASAVCGLHFVGMLSVTYVADEESIGVCKSEVERNASSPDAWTAHQIVDLTVVMLVWSLALVVEGVIYRELLSAYCQLRDPSMTLGSMLTRSNNADGGGGGGGGGGNDGGGRRSRGGVLRSAGGGAPSSKRGLNQLSDEIGGSNKRSNPSRVVSFQEILEDVVSNEKDDGGGRRGKERAAAAVAAAASSSSPARDGERGGEGDDDDDDSIEVDDDDDVAAASSRRQISAAAAPAPAPNRYSSICFAEDGYGKSYVSVDVISSGVEDDDDDDGDGDRHRDGIMANEDGDKEGAYARGGFRDEDDGGDGDDDGGGGGRTGSAAAADGTDGGDGDRDGGGGRCSSLLPENWRDDVPWSKVALVVALLILAIVTAVVVSHHARQTSQAEFDAAFASTAEMVKEAFIRELGWVEWRAGSVAALATREGIIAAAAAVEAVPANNTSGGSLGRRASSSSSSAWPNVTIPNYVDLTYPEGLPPVAGTPYLVAVGPLLRGPVERHAWEEYASDRAATHSPEELRRMGQDGGGGGTQFVPVDPDSNHRAMMAAAMIDNDADERSRGLLRASGRASRQFYGDVGAARRRAQQRTEASDGPARNISDGLWRMDGSNVVDVTEGADGPFLPLWQVAGGGEVGSVVMFDQYSDPGRRAAIDSMLATGAHSPTEILLSSRDDDGPPHSVLYHPIFERFGLHVHRSGSANEGAGNIAAAVAVDFEWRRVLAHSVPDAVRGVHVVLESSSASGGGAVTFVVDGSGATFVGRGDLHDRAFDAWRAEQRYDFGGGGGRSTTQEGDKAEEAGAGGRMLRHGQGSGTAPTRRRTEGEFESGDSGLLRYRIRVYPSETFQTTVDNQREAIIWPITIVVVIFVTAAIFLIYACLRKRRRAHVMKAAEKSSMIVNDHFPEFVRDRLFSELQQKSEVDEESVKPVDSSGSNPGNYKRSRTGSASSLQAYLRRKNSSQFDDQSISVARSPPIADLFTDTTILFADIAGFTAWSSERLPTEVFLLLEQLFREFDRATKKHSVFKVETIGDCYVAVTGLPKPTEDHAVLMVAFAQDCLERFSSLVNELESSLGPGTAELGMRIGLHSGPVTAGVLRGDKSRFQLFGDTMNTASRIESSSEKNMIHVSSTTAELLVSAGKSDLLTPREAMVALKGKGLMKTFWLQPERERRDSDASQSRTASTTPGNEEEAALERSESASSSLPSSSIECPQGDVRILKSLRDSDTWIDTGFGDDAFQMQPSKLVKRLITWNAAVLEKFLIEVMIANREVQRKRRCYASTDEINSALFSADVTDAVMFPAYDKKYASQFTNVDSSVRLSTKLPQDAKEELYKFVSRIAATYKNVHFHNFEHASHVTMSATKLMNKICSRRFEEIKEGDGDGYSKEATTFFNTYSISMDPLAQLAVVFASLIHDADHEGVPNVRLMKEKPGLAEKYGNKSVAENNSIHVAWEILLEPGFQNLRNCMFENKCDMMRFRQLIINLLIATDIADKDRMQREKKRWERAFSGTSSWEEEWKKRSETALITLDVSLKATVVLEQIMLASDVAHTMQHWLTFVKWNERLYKELWSAYVAGRAESDPTVNWYESQIGFYDFYIIPLARKLNKCGVFGTAGEEYLAYALSNRQEWTEKGKEITERFERTIRNAEIVDNEPKYWERHATSHAEQTSSHAS